MAKTYGLTTETRIKARLDIDHTGLDTLIKSLIYGATDIIEKYCNGRRFERQTSLVEYHDGANLSGDAKRFILLKNAPIVSIASIHYNTGTNSAPVWTTWNADYYDKKDRLGVLMCDAGFPKGTQNIKVTYTCGYLIDFTDAYNETVHTLPFDLTEVCEKLVVHFLKKRESEGKTQETLVNSTISWDSYLTADIKAMLAPYRRDIFV